MGRKLQGLEEDVDVAQSALNSILVAGRTGRIEIGPSGSLWPLLVKVASNRIRQRAKYWNCQRRDWRRTVPLQDHDRRDSGPTPEYVARFHELVEQLMEHFSQRRRTIIEHFLGGLSVAAIAHRMDISKRTVYRARQAALEMLEQRTVAS